MNPDKITILIVEDDPIISSDLTYHMKDFGFSPFPAVSNVADALLLLDIVLPDLALIDVSLEGEQDGIELAAIIQEKYDLPLIFLTAHHDRKTLDRIKETRPSAYLVKPLQVHNLQTSIELALYNHSHSRLTASPASAAEDYVSGSHFFMKVKNQLRKAQLDDIIALEAYDNYSFVHTRQQKYIIGSTLKDLEQKLQDYQFVRVHRSFIVNLKAVESIEEDILSAGELRIPLGKTYKEEFMKRIKLL